MNVRSIAVIAATILALTASRGAAQDESTHPLLDSRALSETLEGVWQPLEGGNSPEERPQRSPSLFRDIARDYVRFFSSRETYLTLGLGLAGSLSMKPFDERIANSGFNLELPQNEDGRLDGAFDSGTLLGSSLIQVGGAFATYGVGHFVGRPGVAALGRDLVRVQLLTQGVTQLLKHSVRRTRPDGSSRSSYPSGHASGTFASATVLQRHYGWKVGIPAFGVASYVAASRLAENKHYLSDVILGAAIGITAGRTVTFGKGSTRFELAPMAAIGGAGVQVSVFRLP